jgi:hypothetical protein
MQANDVKFTTGGYKQRDRQTEDTLFVHVLAYDRKQTSKPN